LTGYGSNPFAAGLLPEDCRTGVQQNTLLPISTCDPGSLSSIQFVGPDSPNPNYLYGNPGFMIASQNWTLPHGDLQWSGNSGSLYGDAFTSTPDPQCTDAAQVTPGDKMGTNLQASNVCTIVALARRNPDGTPGEVLLQYSKPGEVGNLGFGNFKAYGNWSMDMSASKSFNLSESKSVQVRVDTTNVFNHPTPGFTNGITTTPGLPSFAAGTFGVTNTKTGERSFQGQLRLNF
jgi:hypothetical protein